PVREQPGRALTETLVEALRPKQTLLLLDNCEHLIQPCARLAQTLLQACAGVRILATSREALHVTGEVAWQVRPLSLPDLAQDRPPPEALRDSEAVQLFVDRA